MAELPSGTVTFLFTDIEGSTTRWEHQPEAMQVALARHDSLLRSAIQEHGGHVVKTMGDAFHAAFARAPDALAAAVHAQRRLEAEPWGEISPLRVRMALHTGAAEERDGDYYGPSLNRAARLLATGHGGQVLLSHATAELVRDGMPDDLSLLDLGEHRLKDLIRLERVFQLVASDLSTHFPPLRTLEVRPSNLPLHPTALLGRERQVAEVCALLRGDARLVSLTGPGGTGKTRLSLQVATDLLDEFEDGAFLVELAPVSDPALVPSTIAQALGLRDVGGRPVLEALKVYARSRIFLLVLDNFEQIVPAASVVSDLVATSAGLKVLVTSREPLRLRGEREYAVPPLGLPDANHLKTVDALASYPAIALFLDRAVAVRADFTMTDENAPAIAEICARLDGLPLALELAAARTRLLTPQAMLSRLERRLPLLTGGARDLPARQQTLRGAIAWSHDLLQEHERRLFRRLAVFVGGWSLEAAEAVCNADGDLGVDVLDGMSSLVSKSLLREDAPVEGDPRFDMFETIREYGVEQLIASGESDAIHQAHAAFFVALVKEAEPHLLAREQIVWLRRLNADHDNLRAILGWCRGGQVASDLGLQLAGTLAWLWHFGGLVGEGREWLDSMLSLPGRSTQTVARACALTAAARLATLQADYAAARPYAQEGAKIFREVGDARGASYALMLQGLACLHERNNAMARPLFEESIVLARQANDYSTLSLSLGNLAAMAENAGDLDESWSIRAESASVAREIGDRHSLGVALAGLALVARRQGKYRESEELFSEALIASSQLGDALAMPRALAGLAGAAAISTEYQRAARLFGAVDAFREVQGTREMTRWRDISDPDLGTVRGALGDDAFAVMWGEGRAMTLQQAIAYALERPASM